MLPTRQLAYATDSTIDSYESAAVALAPHHPFVEGGRDLAPTLDQCAVRVEKQLRVVHGATVAFVDPDGDDHASAAGGLADCMRRRRGHGDRLLQQPDVRGVHFVRAL